MKETIIGGHKSPQWKSVVFEVHHEDSQKPWRDCKWKNNISLTHAHTLCLPLTLVLELNPIHTVLCVHNTNAEFYLKHEENWVPIYVIYCQIVSIGSSLVVCLLGSSCGCGLQGQLPFIFLSFRLRSCTLFLLPLNDGPFNYCMLHDAAIS